MSGQVQPLLFASSSDTESRKYTNFAPLNTSIVDEMDLSDDGFVEVDPCDENVMPYTP
jgi:hypothetical protein